MKILFEDKEEDVLSKLFRVAYVDTSNFIYTNGNGNLAPKAEEILSTSQETVVVYMDAIPGNASIQSVYYKLRALSKKFAGRIWIFPIICSEFYFIRTLDRSHIMDLEAYEVCIRKAPFETTALFKKNIEKCKNYEKFCKLLLITGVDKCIKHTRENNDLYGVYYETDCVCASAKGCKELSLLEKSRKLLSEYRYIPKDTAEESERKYSNEKMKEIHRQFVFEYNLWSDQLQKTNLNRNCKFKKIPEQYWQ